MNVVDRINSLRGLMREKMIDAYIISGTDPHLSEYLPERWQTRKWISGFTGSYGRVVVTHKRVIIWTDSRYFLQANQQLKGSGIEMFKDRQPNTINYDDWIITQLKTGDTIAIDGLTISASEYRSIEAKFGAKGLSLISGEDLLNHIWIDRPLMPIDPVFELPVEIAGLSREHKIETVRQKLKETGADATIITLLDDLAWCFNLRGNDIIYNPLFFAYGYIGLDTAFIFIDESKIPVELHHQLTEVGITILNYDLITEFLRSISGKTILLDPDRTTITIYNSINQRNKIVSGISLPTVLKSVKNETEIEGMRQAHRRDGAAMVNFLYWFDQHIGRECITELTVCEKLKGFRSQQDHFVGESFHPIVGYASHGAIVHYQVTSETDIEIMPENLLLIDSGGQYLDGTTDITRTIAAGEVTQQQRFDFTIALKGTIGLAKAIFPEGTKGYSLDSFARKPLWDNGMNYGHGTGHGVGHFLCVHEGPMSIRQEYNPHPILVGQILSDEPAFYRDGQYGIRTENLILCKEILISDFGRFLGFETLTLCPIDQKLILTEILTDEEKIWLNEYHERTHRELAQLLSPEIYQWMKEQWIPISL